ncbi:MAG: methionyl-tRNA formyltransferase [Gammaproteobacteria bacterium]
MRAIFAGTPEFAVPSLECLATHSSIELVAVYTQPDRRAGRGRQSQASPVKRVAQSLSIPVVQPQTLKDPDAQAEFVALRADLLVVAAYGLILPRDLLAAHRLAVNVHASLLPRWRGAAPIQRAIMAGDAETGISMMRVVEALDAGPVLLQRACEITDTETGGTLHDKLAHLGATCLHETVDDFLAGRLNETPQDETLVCYAKKITAADRVLNWAESAPALARRVRALNPAPAATMTLGATPFKIWEAIALRESAGGPPGRIVAFSDDGIDIATADGVLRVTRLQPPGKRPLSAAEFVNGFQTLLTGPT